MAKFVKTVLVSSIGAFRGVGQVGQWVQLETGQRGQWLGTTAAGVEVVRWQTEGKVFSTRDALANAPLRKFAKVYGSDKV